MESIKKTGPVHFWPRVKILTPRHLCENSKMFPDDVAVTIGADTCSRGYWSVLLAVPWLSSIGVYFSPEMSVLPLEFLQPGLTSLDTGLIRLPVKRGEFPTNVANTVRTL